MHERPVVFKNGLVDPTPLLEFMDGCHCSDLYQPRPVGSHKSEYHHLYFPKKDYKNTRPALSVRKLRNSKYNLIGMLSCQEDFYHQKIANSVPQDQIDLDSAEAYLEEARWLTNYAASSWLIAETKRKLDSSRVTARIKKARLSARLALLNEMNYDDIDQAGRIEVMEPSIVYGALSRYLNQQPEHGVQDLVESHIAKGGVLIPTKVYTAGGLRTNAETRLRERIDTQSWIVRRILSVPATEAA